MKTKWEIGRPFCKFENNRPIKQSGLPYPDDLGSEKAMLSRYGVAYIRYVIRQNTTQVASNGRDPRSTLIRMALTMQAAGGW